MQRDTDRRMLEQIEQQVDLASSRVLEIGCGRGRVTARLAARAAGLVALDPVQSALRVVGDRLPGQALVAARGEMLPFAPACFDVVVFTLSLHHHRDAASALSEAARVLVPGGRVLVIEPDESGLLERVFAQLVDEGSAVAAAQRAVARCPLRLAYDAGFNGCWRFDDHADLIGAVFDHYALPEDPATVARIDALLGPECRARPILLEDRMRLQMLQPG
ncbi:class I SAM-dependent methyltransferase [Marichromatium bheemlicum]|uniref:Class I SAM-dependent methyltransferase n=1 Tax=Marichromatium bheemlicum TaxID=365339 RepID=A0ABX1IA95_9GAMM|nr:class I SAM-dependent methyltransferase [Marichromatium bheemlicum]NKN33776.1 class I SAM-dependent methyltransferase [Marichromatium bheemlicum]